MLFINNNNNNYIQYDLHAFFGETDKPINSPSLSHNFSCKCICVPFKTLFLP